MAELGKNSLDENLIISDKSTSDDDENTGIEQEGVEVNEEAENVSKGIRNDDELIVYTYIVIISSLSLWNRFSMLNL